MRELDRLALANLTVPMLTTCVENAVKRAMAGGALIARSSKAIQRNPGSAPAFCVGAVSTLKSRLRPRRSWAALQSRPSHTEIGLQAGAEAVGRSDPIVDAFWRPLRPEPGAAMVTLQRPDPSGVWQRSVLVDSHTHGRDVLCPRSTAMFIGTRLPVNIGRACGPAFTVTESFRPSWSRVRGKLHVPALRCCIDNTDAGLGDTGLFHLDVDVQLYRRRTESHIGRLRLRRSCGSHSTRRSTLNTHRQLFHR